MGLDSVTEQMLEGEVCCGCARPIGSAVGYTRLCTECGGEPDLTDSSESQARRAANRENSNRLLRENGYQFDEKNEAAHLIVQTESGVIDFWPGTGKWMSRFRVGGWKREGRGVFNLMRLATPSCPVRGNQPQEIRWARHMTPFAIKTYIDAGFDVVGAPEEWK